MLVLKMAKDLNVEQLPGVVRHQIGGKLKEIWKRLHHSGSSLEKRLSASMPPTEMPEVMK
jgi:hypothetical protein